MSKYKEAKQYIDMIWSEPSWSRVDIDWLAIEQIKELVDRETPMKPNRLPYNLYGLCRCCNKDLIRTRNWIPNYCSKCGQKVDWSDEE